jgi:Mrp family chromosome partitioning ATPase
LTSLLRELREQFEHIIVDSPAILPVDGGTFVEQADRIVFVIAWESTDRTAVEQAFGMLGGHLSKLAGVVLNKTDARWYRTFDDGRYLRYASPPVAPTAVAPAPAPAPAPARVAVFSRRAAP